MMIKGISPVYWVLLAAFFLGGCVQTVHVASQDSVKLEPKLKPIVVADSLWGELGDYLKYYERIGALSKAEVDKELVRLLKAIDNGSQKAKLYLALARMHPGTGIYEPIAARKWLAAVAGKGAMPDSDLKRFVMVLEGGVASQKSFEIMAAKKNNELASAENKIKRLEQDVHRYKQEAQTLAAQIQELKDIEKLIIERQSTKNFNDKIHSNEK